MARPSKAAQQAKRKASNPAPQANDPKGQAAPRRTDPNEPTIPSMDRSDLTATDGGITLGEEPVGSSCSDLSIPTDLDGSPAFEPLLTVEEVSLWLRKPKGTLYAWRSRGLGPRAYKVGNELRYMRRDVLQWLGSVA